MELNLSKEVVDRLMDMAAYREMTPDQLVQDALQRFFTDCDLLAQEIHEAVKEADRDGWLTTEEVFGKLNGLHKQPA